MYHSDDSCFEEFHVTVILHPINPQQSKTATANMVKKLTRSKKIAQETQSLSRGLAGLDPRMVRQYHVPPGVDFTELKIWVQDH